MYPLLEGERSEQVNPREFFDTVVEMRVHQRNYERSHGRDPMAKRCAKDYEQRIDKEIARVKLMEREQANQRLDL